MRVAMRDGIELSANVFRPAEPGRFPAILVRTPYGKGTALSAYYRSFVEDGYAVVIEDVRGRHASEGSFEPLTQEVADGEDTLAWVAHQPWSSRRVGMLGASYVGIVQWKAALSASPYLKAIFPMVSGSDEYLDRFYSTGGALKLGHRLEWMSENLKIPGYRPDFARFIRSLPLRRADRMATGGTVDFFQQALDHPAYDAFWRTISTREHLDRVHVPVLAVGGWYDNFVESDLEAFRLMREQGRIERLIIGPWAHNFTDTFDGIFTSDSRVPLPALQREWFDHWVKRAAPNLPAGPPLRIFIMGANRWRDEEEWPLRRAVPLRLYLAARRRANSLAGDGKLQDKPQRKAAHDRFVYDPVDPAPTLGGAICCNPKLLPWGPMDQRTVETRRDVLVYTSSPLRKPLEVTGPVRVVVYVSTSAADTDFTAKLVDVFPDGRARNLCDGLLRMRYRESLARAVASTPGRIYPIVINAGVTSNEFGKGHRIRLEISSSNFPRFDRNPNTGRLVADERELRQASQAVYHDQAMPSHLLLPVIPPKTPEPAGSLAPEPGAPGIAFRKSRPVR